MLGEWYSFLGNIQERGQRLRLATYWTCRYHLPPVIINWKNANVYNGTIVMNNLSDKGYWSSVMIDLRRLRFHEQYQSRHNKLAADA